MDIVKAHNLLFRRCDAPHLQYVQRAKEATWEYIKKNPTVALGAVLGLGAIAAGLPLAQSFLQKYLGTK